VRYTPGSESTEQRELGFLETMDSDFPAIRILERDAYAGTTELSALQKSQDLLFRHGANVQGVFCVCEPVAMGMHGALSEADLLGKVPFVGFDPTERMVQALGEKQMAGIVLQDPVKMGYLAVKTMYDHLEGRTVEKRVDTGQYIATPENMNEPEMQKLLKPKQFSEPEFAPAATKYRIAVIPKGTTHEFWKSVRAGAEDAARELGNVDILWRGPQEENDGAMQISVVENFIVEKVSGICLAPLDSQSLVQVVKQAKDAGVPTVIFDSDLADKGDLKISYVATDNYKGGALAARRLGELIQADREASKTPVAVAADP
jgi:ribose transport system substrate-binding protein